MTNPRLLSFQYYRVLQILRTRFCHDEFGVQNKSMLEHKGF